MNSSSNHRNRKLSITASCTGAEIYSDSRTHGYQGPNRHVRLPRITSTGGGVAKNEDGTRCAVAGNDSLRILRILHPQQPHSQEHKFAVGRGGHRIEATRNLWEGTGLSSASTDVAWARGAFDNKILTSARNGELIMWDVNKSSSSKYERRTKDHSRSINQLSVSRVVHNYCITGSADGDLRVWDLRDLSKSIMRIYHPTSVRGVVFSPSLSHPLQAAVGLDNGSIYRWDLKMGQRGQLDRLPVAHSSPVTTIDWCNDVGQPSSANSIMNTVDNVYNGLGWLATGGLDRIVKIWDLTAPGTSVHIPHKATYTLHPSFPVKRVLWRPNFPCEVAIVSNSEFSPGSNSETNATGSTSVLPRAASGLAIDRLVSLNVGSSVSSSTEKTSSTEKRVAGDPIEIWDVRRGWIAKWSVNGSTSEGGVTDVVFGDSYAIWAQHSSGTFSQLDLRDCSKPIDSIPRVSTTWQVNGAFTFVTDCKKRWELPYDDISPENYSVAEEKKVKIKSIGETPYTPRTQSIGCFCDDASAEESEAFENLAHGYVFEGEQRTAICEFNANIALQAGKAHAAQVWFLLGTCLTDLVPDNTTASTHAPLIPDPDSSIARSTSAPAAIPSIYSTPSISEQLDKSTDSAPAAIQRTSPGATSGTYTSEHGQRDGFRRSSSTSLSRRITPTSSNSSSPHHLPGVLPPITPRQPSYIGRRNSVEAILMRKSSMLRRPSVSNPSIIGASPTDKPNNSSGSLRHVGEGALDDSDSSSSDDGVREEVSSEEESNLRPLISPALMTTARAAPAHPSPLSQIAGRHRWIEDDNDDPDSGEEASPSPRSTDTESGGSSSPHRRGPPSRSRRRSSTRVKSRSRSSTVASLAAPAVQRTLVKQDSHSSVRTVTVGEVSFRDQDHCAPADGNHKELAHAQFMLRPQSESLLGLNTKPVAPDRSKYSDRRPEFVRADEAKYRQLSWDVLRAVLEEFADEGDVQMCAMLALVAPRELGIDAHRALRFVDAYIELLTRNRLYTCSAYIRKCSQVKDVAATTLIETTIYTSCTKCKKPLVLPAGGRIQSKLPKGGFAYCLSCKQSCIRCAICSLPVRSLLIQCPVCCHGGHQACYRGFYMKKPMVNLTRPVIASQDSKGRPKNQSLLADAAERDHDSSTHSGDVIQAIPIFGHPCAAGCGHFCWAANRAVDA